MNKVLVKLYIPALGEEYDVWLPLNKRIYNIIVLMIKGISELQSDYCKIDTIPNLYNKATGEQYDINKKLIQTDIKNGTELILI